MDLTREQLDAIPDKYLATIVDILSGMSNETVDLTTPQVRQSVENIYPLFIAVYSLLIVAGTLTNCAMIYHIVRGKLYRDPTYAYLINIAVSDIIECVFVLPISLAVLLVRNWIFGKFMCFFMPMLQCVLVLPISLAVLLVRNWIFGKFMCFFMPMLQDIPIHVSMMTFVLIAGDRYRLVSDPGKPRIPAFVCAIGAWFFAVCIVLPHPIYTTYLDLETYMKQHFRGVGICVRNLTDDIQQYMRGLFVLTYIAPLAITAYIYVKASRELQGQEGPLAVAMLEARTKDSYSRQGSNTSNDVPSLRDGQRESVSVGTNVTTRLSGFSHSYDLYDAELDVSKEKRTQKYLIFMVAVFAILFCPLMVLKLAKLALVETYENIGTIDITFTIFVWIAFVSTVTTPVLYASWQMSRQAKERFRGYFCCSERSLTEVVEDTASVPSQQTPRRGRGLANVAYTRNSRIGSTTESNGLSGSSRSSPSMHSPATRTNRTHQTNTVP